MLPQVVRCVLTGGVCTRGKVGRSSRRAGPAKRCPCQAVRVFALTACVLLQRAVLDPGAAAAAGVPLSDPFQPSDSLRHLQSDLRARLGALCPVCVMACRVNASWGINGESLAPAYMVTSDLRRDAQAPDHVVKLDRLPHG